MTRSSGPFCAAAILAALSVSGCSLPSMSGWFGGDEPARTLTVSNAPAPSTSTSRAALADSAAAQGMIVDAQSGCGTSNPFPQPNERIRWYGGCADGKLAGKGTLIWYRGTVETERNEGRFRAGELHGPAITTYPDGRFIVGSYSNGARDGDFVINRGEGLHVSAAYQNGRLVTQREMAPSEVADWQRRRAGGEPVQLAEAPAPASASVALYTAPQVAAVPSTPIPQPAPVAPAASPAALPASSQPLAVASEQVARAPGLTPSSSYLDPRWQTVSPVAVPIPAAPAYPAPPAPAAVAIQGTPGSQLAQLSGAVRAASMPGVSAGTMAAADSLFAEAYQFERAGQPAEAARRYDEILLRYPSAPSALLANARLGAIRGGGAVTTPAATPVAAAVTNQRRVVPVNAPSPGNTQRPASLNPSLVADSPALYRTVCTRDGLYESNSGWCGVVTGVETAHYRVEIRRIHLRGFMNIGITRSTCTGNTFLNWFSRGTQVRVPQQCVLFRG